VFVFSEIQSRLFIFSVPVPTSIISTLDGTQGQVYLGSPGGALAMF
jgi:hypothetical protein